mmetsp:Transcript_12780/g.32689  ORF Transcript_12780/g.32689 Transcript_12780/m.32689 type:complete len:204 (+) Transcript_12780:72-683(+)
MPCFSCHRPYSFLKNVSWQLTGPSMAWLRPMQEQRLLRVRYGALLCYAPKQRCWIDTSAPCASHCASIAYNIGASPETYGHHAAALLNSSPSVRCTGATMAMLSAQRRTTSPAPAFAIRVECQSAESSRCSRPAVMAYPTPGCEMGAPACCSAAARPAASLTFASLLADQMSPGDTGPKLSSRMVESCMREPSGEWMTPALMR